MADLIPIEERSPEKRAEQLKQIIDQVFDKFAECETDPHFGYRVYLLQNEAQARIFRLQRSIYSVANEAPPPTKGRYVAATITLLRGRFLLAYCEFPEGGGESVHHDMLEYDPREYDKIQQHVVTYLATGVIPQADGEFSPVLPKK
jgi:hypothetical protein